MIKTKAGRSSGFTMVELLIAVIIIGILVTIIVPVLSNRAADARIAAAKADMEAIANAQSQSALDTGYVVRLYVLDDSGAQTDTFSPGNPLDVVDTIRDEDGHTDALNPDLIFLDPKTGEVIPNPTLHDRVQVDPEGFGWRGPYVNYQRKLPINVPSPTYVAGAPLDPWGNPYFLFVPGPEIVGTISNGLWLDDRDGALQNTFDYVTGYVVPTDQFDRLTLLSLGPNGTPGSGPAGSPTALLGMGDDLIRAF